MVLLVCYHFLIALYGLLLFSIVLFSSMCFVRVVGGVHVFVVLLCDKQCLLSLNPCFACAVVFVPFLRRPNPVAFLGVSPLALPPFIASTTNSRYPLNDPCLAVNHA